MRQDQAGHTADGNPCNRPEAIWRPCEPQMALANRSSAGEHECMPGQRSARTFLRRNVRAEFPNRMPGYRSSWGGCSMVRRHAARGSIADVRLRYRPWCRDDRYNAGADRKPGLTRVAGGSTLGERRGGRHGARHVSWRLALRAVDPRTLCLVTLAQHERRDPADRPTSRAPRYHQRTSSKDSSGSSRDASSLNAGELRYFQPESANSRTMLALSTRCAHFRPA